MKTTFAAALVLLALAACTKDEESPAALTADFTLPANAETHTELSFANQSRNATRYKWTFGDGSAATTAASPQHTFATQGTYPITLTAYHNTDSVVVTKSLPVRLYDVLTHLGLRADFTLPASTMAKRPVQFQNTSQNAQRYQWNFGDDSTSTATNPTHTYATAGRYTVTLQAYGATGPAATTTKQVQVQPHDILAYGALPVVGRYLFKVTRSTLHANGVFISGAERDTILSITRAGADSIRLAGYLGTFQRIVPANSPTYSYPAGTYMFGFDIGFRSTGLLLCYPTDDAVDFNIEQAIGHSTNYTQYKGRLIR